MKKGVKIAKWLAASAMALVLVLGRSAVASPALTAADLYLTQDTSATLQVFVTDSGDAATEDIEGMTLTAQLAGGSGSTPSITGVDALSGTVWSGHTSPFDITTPAGGSQPQFQSRDLITDSGGDYINANGLLATLTIDATGAAPGPYTLIFTGTIDPGSDSQFQNGVGDPVAATFGSATIHVTAAPEPAALVLLAALPLLFARRRRAAGR
jgi:hypothetical protein